MPQVHLLLSVVRHQGVRSVTPKVKRRERRGHVEDTPVLKGDRETVDRHVSVKEVTGQLVQTVTKKGLSLVGPGDIGELGRTE